MIDPLACDYENLRVADNGVTQCLACRQVFYDREGYRVSGHGGAVHCMDHPSAIESAPDYPTPLNHSGSYTVLHDSTEPEPTLIEPTEQWSFSILHHNVKSTSPRRFSNMGDALDAIAERMELHARDHEFPSFALVRYTRRQGVV